jgi:cobalt-zinc-cadmium resistance protein CzcA
MPTLDEFNIDLAAVRVPSISMEQSKSLDFKVERALLELPEIALVFSKAGTAIYLSSAAAANAAIFLDSISSDSQGINPAKIWTFNSAS